MQFWKLEVDMGLTELKWKCWEGLPSSLDTLKESLFSVSKHSSHFLLILFHLQNQWWLVESFSCHITLMLLPPSSSFWDPCGYNGPTQIIQDNLPIFKVSVLLGRKVMINLDSIFKSRDITLPTNVHLVRSDQIRSVAQSCPTLCNPMNRSTPGLPVHHQLPEFTQTHVHRVSDAIQPSHPLSSPSPPAPNPSQHQSLFQWVNTAWGGQSTGVSASASFLPKKSQGWSPSEWTGWLSLQSKGLWRVFSNTTVQKHQFFGTQPSSQSNSHIHTWP